jgi:hypothetical protein
MSLKSTRSNEEVAQGTAQSDKPYCLIKIMQFQKKPEHDANRAFLGGHSNFK